MKPLVIRYTYSRCKIVQGDPSVLRQVLSCRDPRARFRKGFRFGGGGGDERFSVYDWRNKTFPTGLLDKVETRCRDRGVPLRVINRPKTRPIDTTGVTPDLLHGISLRAHQFKALLVSLAEERGFLWIATNGGKTEIIAAVASVLRDKENFRTLVIEPSKLLLIQTAERLKKRLGRGVEIGMVGDGHRGYGADIVISTFQTLSRRLRTDKDLLNMLKSCQCIIIDEGHRSAAASVRKILDSSPARIRLAVTGTMRTKHAVNDFIRRAYIGPCLMKVSNHYLMKKGYSAHAVVFAVTDQSMFHCDFTAPAKVYRRGALVDVDPLERSKQESDSLVQHAPYNKAITEAATSLVDGGLKPLILSASIAHVKLLTSMCEQAGLRAYLLWGNVPGHERVARIKKFTHDPKGVLIGSSVLDEGADVPVIGSIILADDVKNVRQVLQRVGRGVRAKGDELNAILVLDFSASCGYYIAKHALERIQIYEEERFEVHEVTNFSKWLDQARSGWKSLLGSERYGTLLASQKKKSAD